MKKMRNNNYKEYFENINIDQGKKNQIFDNIVNKKVYSFKFKFAYIMLCFFIIIFGTSLVYADEIKEMIKEHIYVLRENKTSDENDKSYSCLIYNNVVDDVNNEVQLQNSESLSYSELNGKLNLDVLSSDLFNEEYFQTLDFLYENNKLSFVKFQRDDIDLKKLTDTIYDSSKINFKFSLLTTNASIDVKNEKIVFYKGICDNKNFEVIELEKFDVYLYRPSKIAYAYEDIEFNNRAYFVYDNIIYEVEGYLISKDTLIDFIKTLG